MFFEVCGQGGGTQQHQGQPAAISCAWRSCQNASTRPLCFRSARPSSFSQQRLEGWDLGRCLHLWGQTESHKEAYGTLVKTTNLTVLLGRWRGRRPGTLGDASRANALDEHSLWKHDNWLNSTELVAIGKNLHNCYNDNNHIVLLPWFPFNTHAWRVRCILAWGYFYSLPFTKTWADLPVTSHSELQRENVLNCQLTSKSTSLWVYMNVQCCICLVIKYHCCAWKQHIQTLLYII